MKPRYSIIVPIYNVAPYLATCLDSVLRQREKDWECICVDDGSTDGSGEILDAYQQGDNRFRVLHKSNGGVSSARNAALDLCRGDWILYLDADDFLTDDALAIFDKIAREVPDVELMHCEIVGLDETANRYENLKSIDSFSVYQERERARILTGHLGIGFSTYAYKRSVMGVIRFENYVIGEDRLYLARCHAVCHVKAWSMAVGYCCRRRRNSASRSKWTLRKFFDEVNTRRQIIDVVYSVGERPCRCGARMILLSLMEHSTTNIDRIDAEQRDEAWRVYFQVMDTVGKSIAVTGWQRFVLVTLKATHSKLLGRLLCICPYRMKATISKIRKGVRSRRGGACAK